MLRGWRMRGLSRVLPGAGPAQRAGASPPGAQRIWIDTDGGIDDAQGILLALAHEGSEVVGISTVRGNVGAQQAAQNVARIVTLASDRTPHRRAPPFYVGSDVPLLLDALEPSTYFGKDGLGDVPDVYPAVDTITLRPTPGVGASKLAEAAAEHGELSVIAIGPLTNVALACLLDPAFPSNVRTLYVMGGAKENGNVPRAPLAEYNFYADPEAAYVVMKMNLNLELLTWDCAVAHPVPWTAVDGWFSCESTTSQFVKAIMGKVIDRSEPGWTTGDALLTACALQPELVTSTRSLCCRINLPGLCRGVSVFDRSSSGVFGPPNIKLICGVDLEGFDAMMTSVVKG